MTATRKLKSRKCKAAGCDNEFIPFSSLESWCSPACGYALSQEKLARKERAAANKAKAERRAAKRAFRENDAKHVRKGAVAYFHKWIRHRDWDRGLPCVACNEPLAGKKIDASHFRPSGSKSAVRFHEDNVNAGCAQCNTFRAGNLIEYRVNLINRIGVDRVEWLEGQNQVKTWTIDELREIRDDYGGRLKAMGIKLPSITH